jgi:hypothetical protein
MAADKRELVLTNGKTICVFDSVSGQPLYFEGPDMHTAGKEIYLEIGCDGSTLSGLLEFDCLDHKRTWELPIIKPVKDAPGNWTYTGFEKNENMLKTFYLVEGVQITVIYGIVNDNINISADIKNITCKRQIISGIAFIVKDQNVDESTTFEFPGNVPFNEFKFEGLKDLSVIQTGLVNPIIHTCTAGNHMNVIFIDNEEKWGTGVYKENKNTLTYINFAAVESYLDPGETLHCGELYVQLIGKNNPYNPVRELYKYLGFEPATGGISDGVMYSCHPHGTMDANFPDRRTMQEYAEELEDIRKLGVDHVWVLPIFEHKERGVYHPTDQAIIDERYGGDAAVRYFCDRAHKLGMTVLFDYVPHGPELNDPLGKEHREWCSENREGEPVIEWNCVSFDMANPLYLEYHKELVKDHIKRFDIDGSRIDCAMGGLTNWKPYSCNRPSNSNLKGGIEISGAIRQAFVETGKTPIVTPENFNPVPMYYKYTDIFYDMPLYRVFCELDAAQLTSEQFAYELTRWLNAELLTTPGGYSKMRFLGNHDTVSWVFQKARAPKVYGEAKAKALWALISFIDGMPMLYQGDEDPRLCRGEGPVLRNFFKELFYARKTYLGNHFDMEYELTGTPVVSFTRKNCDLIRRVLVNFSPEEVEYETNAKIRNVLYGDCSVKEHKVTLQGFGYVILDIE